MAATQPVTHPVLQVVYRTDPGLAPDKQVNEDACGEAVVPLGHLLVVCDGMGGHVGGKQASETAVRTIVEQMKAATSGLPGEALTKAIEEAGRKVYALAPQGSNRMRPGSTVVALLTHALGTEVAHVGDSRAYLIREGQTYALTKDHSMVQQMVDAGMISQQEAAVHPDANKITRALGMHPEVEVELRPVALEHHKGDIFLLATDGLCDLVRPEELAPLVMQAKAARGLAFAADQLVALANNRGGHDNITVLLAEVIEAPQLPTTSPQEGGKQHVTVPLLPTDQALAGPGSDVTTTQPGSPQTQVMKAAPTVPDGPPGPLLSSSSAEVPDDSPPTTLRATPTGMEETRQGWNSAETLGNTVEEDHISPVPSSGSAVRWIAGGVVLLVGGLVMLVLGLVAFWWFFVVGSSHSDFVSGSIARGLHAPERPHWNTVSPCTNEGRKTRGPARAIRAPWIFDESLAAFSMRTVTSLEKRT